MPNENDDYDHDRIDSSYGWDQSVFHLPPTLMDFKEIKTRCRPSDIKFENIFYGLAFCTKTNDKINNKMHLL